MGEFSLIAWTHHSQNWWVGCDKIDPLCAKCYIDRILLRQGREPWGQVYRTKTWDQPLRWEKKASAENLFYRVFTCSLSDFFHVKADAWRPEAWQIMKATPHMIYLVLTKRPELIAHRLPPDWGVGYPNVWMGTSVGCNRSLNKMDSLRKIPCALRFISAEPLIEDISERIDLTGFKWAITGGESGTAPEYLWDTDADWRAEFNTPGRRIMKLEWAQRLFDKCDEYGLCKFFKQITAARPGQGADALGRIIQEFPQIEGKWADAPAH